MDLVEINNLTVCYSTESGEVKAVDGVSFGIHRNETIGLVGESGCGKSTLSLSILKLVPPGTKIYGNVFYEGKDLVQMNDSELSSIRWKRISLIHQGTMNAFNPLQRCKDQVAEAILIHEKPSKSKARERANELLQMVGIDGQSGDKYPHELSGGMKQRAMIAMSIACNPELVIADEPTTALDVIMQDQVLSLMQNLQRRLGLSILFVSHSLMTVGDICNRIAVMYAGKLVELADTPSIFKHSYHPYTQGLMASNPKMRMSKDEKSEWSSIPGEPPSLIHPPTGCRFHVRCPYSQDVCKREEPKMREIENGHYVACHIV
jgi:peptide/nickel transport system ATP-binding protein